MCNTRSYTIIVGSKEFFTNKLSKKCNVSLLDSKNDFLSMVRKHEEYNKSIVIRGLPNTTIDKFERSDIMVVRNDDYHGITDTAHDRLGALIEDLTTDTAQIFVHNPTKLYTDYLEKLNAKGQIQLICEQEQYAPLGNAQRFANNIADISKIVIGQDAAINEIGKSMWYLTRINPTKPFIIMLYGKSGVGKTEMVRAIAKKFYNSKVLEKHLSMFKNDINSYYIFGDRPNRTSIGFDLLQRESNIVFFDEFDKLPEYFRSVFYTLFDNTLFSDTTYSVDISRLLIFLTSNYNNQDEMKEHLGLPIYYRIDKFIHFDDFSEETIYRIAKNEIDKHVAESDGSINADDLYARVSNKLMAKGENARTIKNTVLCEVENLLFEEVFSKAWSR